MGLLDRFFGKPGKDQFARLMADAIRAAGETTPLRYDAARFQLVAQGEGSNLFKLANVYSEYCAAPKAKRPELIRRFSRSWFAHRRELPATLDDAAPDLLPSVRARSYFELNQLQLEAQGMGSADWPYRPLAGHLGVGLVYDLPDSIVQLQQHHLDEWHVSFEEALDSALRNLGEVSDKQFESPAPGVWRSPWRDNHDAARLLLVDALRQYEVQGDLVAMVPNRDTVLLTGSEDEDGLVELAELGAEALGQTRSISGLALRLEGDEWQPFLPEPGHPAYTQLRTLWVKSRAGDYQDQGELLRALHEKSGEDIFVASFSAVQSRDSGELHSYSVWSEGVDTLLPRTDEVFFFRPGADQASGEIVAAGPWERVQEVAGSLLVLQDLYPERYRVQEFPTADQLATIGLRRFGD
jgi:hypothetical protein